MGTIRDITAAVPSGHSILSPSGAEKWLHCAASALLEQDLSQYGGNDGTTAATIEGTLAHELCAEALLETLSRDYEKSERLTSAYASSEVTSDMEESARAYCDYVMALYRSLLSVDGGTEIYVERQVDLGRWVAGCYGTADCVVVGGGVLHVIDFKYGAGVSVSAVDNPQLKLYALGSLSALPNESMITKVYLHIYQPRCGGVSVWQTTVEELYRFGETVREAATAALRREATATAGPWCRFCRGRSCCAALAERSVSTATGLPDIRLVSDRDLGERVLPVVSQIRAWLTSVEEYALERINGGALVPGWKVGPGRSMRYITDAAEAHRRLNAAGYDDADVMKPEELTGLTELERIVGRKKLAELIGDLLDKRPGRARLMRDDTASDFERETKKVINK